ncbi:MAG: hypothetical protein J7K89_09830 [Candidatus Cloacimonetes bacterium]|nr:hypothetical protein [Candidatus Cloacimonadota bacterium]
MSESENTGSRNLDAGTHSYQWNGTNDEGQTVPSGIYFYKAQVGTVSHTRKMIMMK